MKTQLSTMAQMSLPPDPSTPSLTRSLILGCGYVGRSLLQQLVAEGGGVAATTRSHVHAAVIQKLGGRPLIVDVTQPITLAALRGELEQPLDVYWLIPPGRQPEAVLIEGQAALLKTLKNAPIRRAVWVSSSAVYGDQGGAVVDADAPASPDSPRAKLLYEAEQRWLDAGDVFGVVRLAGLYGMGRVPGAKQVSEGAPLLGDPQAWINLIHADDAAALVRRYAQSESAARVELGADGSPMRRADYYAFVAECLGKPAPQAMAAPVAAITLGLNADRLAKTSSKALDPTITQTRTGWAPRFADAREAIRSILCS